MKRDDVKAIFADATDEQLEKVMRLNNADVEKLKSRAEKAETALNDKKTEFDTLSSEFEKLKQSNATAEDYEAKFKALQADVKAKEEKAEADRKAKEKADGIAARFAAALGEKKFSHEAIKADYLRKFGEALESKDNEGKSDADIFHALTKDDGAAFQGITVTHLPGGSKTADKGAGVSRAAQLAKQYHDSLYGAVKEN